MPERVVVTFFNDHSLVVSKRTRIFLIFELYIYIYIYYIYILRYQLIFKLKKLNTKEYIIL